MYQHKIQYYETDKMGITHHSNYVRFMEEARSYALEQAGYGYDKMEENKIFIPTISVSLDYKKTTTYGDILDIETKVTNLTPARVEIEYVMKRGDEIVCTAKSSHCFLNENSRPVAVKKTNPDIYKVFESMLETKGEL